MGRLVKCSALLFAAAILVNGESLFAQDSPGERVRQLFQSHCVECHGPQMQKAELRLDGDEVIARGGVSGPAIVAGKPSDSPIYQRITLPANDIKRMPNKGAPLTSDEIALVRAWIESGTPLGTIAGVVQTAQINIPIPNATDLPSREIKFNRDVRPILAGKCYQCHGPDGAARQADLRLDNREDALRERKGRVAIVPGDLKASALVARIYHPAASDRMPPEISEKTLSETEKQTLASWIARGAEYEPHWAFIPPQPVEPPSSAKRPIDAFIQAGIDKAGLTAAPQADPITLVRRLSFDLTGLPPDPKLADDFAAAPTNEKYAKLVDQFMASPHFGERMALRWLDLVRYADSNGYHSDETKSIWPYRDYVIRAFNENKPFDVFTREQIAGDILPSAGREQLVASGFNRLNQISAEGGAQAKEYRAKYNADRVRAISTVFLGATIGCAECHDHKFDPFTQRDFYSMAAFFADLEEDDVFPSEDDWAPIMPLPTDSQQAYLDSLTAFIASLESATRTPTPELANAQREWESAVRSQDRNKVSGWLPQVPVEFRSEGGADLHLLDDFSIIASGEIPFYETYEVKLSTKLERITGVRLEAMWDPSFKKSVTRLRSQFYLNEFEVEAGGTKIAIAKAESDEKGVGGDASKSIDGDINSAWYRYLGPADWRKTITASFAFQEPIAGGEGTTLLLRLRHQGGAMFDRTAFARIRFSLTTDAEPSNKTPTSPPECVFDEKTPESADRLRAYYRTIAPELEPIRMQITESREKQRAMLEKIPTTMISKQREHPRIMRVLKRGNWQDESGEIVAAAIPAFLASRKGEAWPTRMDLADWILSRENPLTARVFVNRLWREFFGRGLSRSVEDLGAQGEWPTHPELLDWLALDFMNSGWDIKRMVREIVMTDAYRRSSSVETAARDADPRNDWFARQSASRHDAEIIRDNALWVAGLLNMEIGGPSVKPYQPEGYWDHLNFPRRTWVSDTGAKQYRRGMYVHWQRSFVHPSLKAFDAPSREECSAARPTSNTPLQALASLNDPTYVEAARVFAIRILQEGGASNSERIRWAFHRTLSRLPTADESAVLEDILHKHTMEYVIDENAPDELIANGLAPTPADIDKTELSAWISVARVLLNLHETVTRS